MLHVLSTDWLWVRVKLTMLYKPTRYPTTVCPESLRVSYQSETRIIVRRAKLSRVHAYGVTFKRNFVPGVNIEPLNSRRQNLIFRSSLLRRRQWPVWPSKVVHSLERWQSNSFLVIIGIKRRQLPFSLVSLLKYFAQLLVLWRIREDELEGFFASRIRGTESCSLKATPRGSCIRGKPSGFRSRRSSKYASTFCPLSSNGRNTGDLVADAVSKGSYDELLEIHLTVESLHVGFHREEGNTQRC